MKIKMKSEMKMTNEMQRKWNEVNVKGNEHETKQMNNKIENSAEIQQDLFKSAILSNINKPQVQIEKMIE